MHACHDQKGNGLHFGPGFTVKRLSGPVSLCVLQSTDSALPVVIMAGDAHGRYKDLCNTSFDLRKPRFFEWLDRMPYANQTSVYLEYFDYSLRKRANSFEDDIHKSFRGGVMHDVLGYGIPCLHPRLLTCSTSHLKWEMGDVRYALIKGNLSIEMGLLLLGKPGLVRPYLQTANKRLVQVIGRIVSSVYDPSTRTITIDRFIDTFVDEIMKPNNVKYSLIATVVKSHRFLISSAQLKQWIRRAISVSMQRSDDNAAENPSAYKSILSHLSVDELTWEFWAEIRSFLIEIYTLLKITNETSKLVVAYYGADHVAVLMDLFVKYFGYKPKFVKADSPHHDKRCVDIEQPVNIEKMIRG